MKAHVFTFGPHAGERITRVPQPYLRALAEGGSHPSAILAREELDRRGAVPIGAVIITGHAMDRASQKLLAAWIQGRTPGEGLHHWLHRWALDALQHGDIEGAPEPDDTEHRILGGFRFIFRRPEGVPVLLTVMPRREKVETGLAG